MRKLVNRLGPLALCLSLLSSATVATGGTDDTAKMPTGFLEEVSRMHPDANIKSARPTPIPGIYELIAGRSVVYIDETGRYLLHGRLLDLQRDVDLTAEPMRRALAIDVASLPGEDAITVTRGAGTRQIYVFADPDCPYCQQLEAALEEVDDLTTSIFLYPLTQIHPGAYRKSVSIWCSEDREAAWLAAVRDGKQVPTRNCPHPVDRTMALGDELQVAGTPTIILADGSRYGGDLTAAALQSALAKTAR